jgi:hypothetical protein
MDVDSPRTWVGAAMATLAGLFAWSAKRNVAALDEARKEQSKRVDDLSARVRMLETNVATRQDIEGVYERLNSLGDTMTEQNTRVLELLVRERR